MVLVDGLSLIDKKCFCGLSLTLVFFPFPYRTALLAPYYCKSGLVAFICLFSLLLFFFYLNSELLSLDR